MVNGSTARRGAASWVAVVAAPLTLIVGVALTLTFVRDQQRRVDETTQDRVEAAATVLGERITNEVERAVTATAAAKSAYFVSDAPSLDDYGRVLSSLSLEERHPALFSLNAGFGVRPDQDDEYAQYAAAAGLPDLGPPAEPGLWRAPITFVHPVNEATLPLIGFDVVSNPAIRPFNVGAIETGEPKITPPFEAAGIGIPVFVIYDSAGEFQGAGHTFVGLTGAVFAVGTFVNVIEPLDGVSARIYDSGTEQLLGEIGTRPANAVAEASSTIDVLGREWLLDVSADSSFADSTASTTPIFVLGLIASVLAAALILGIDRSRRFAERRVEERTQELVHTNHALVRASEVKDDFLAMVSHELRTPLAMMLGFAETAEQKADDPQVTRMAFGKVREHGRRLEDLLDKLLRARALDAGVSAHPRDTALAPIVRDAAASVEVADVVVGVAPDLTAHVDPDQMHIILENLLANAKRYGRPPVEVVAKRSGDRVLVTVRDHGDGVPKGREVEVWQRFRQGEHGTQRTVQGVGLGLALVRELVIGNNGEVRYREADDGGAVFELDLPAAASPTIDTPARVVSETDSVD